MNCLNGDCLELMKTLPDHSIDLFVCDLPYGCLKSGGKEKKKRNNGINITGGCSWDIKIDLDKFWIEVKRLCKNDNTPVLMFCNTIFGIDLINSNKDWFRYDIVWNKDAGTNFLLANKMPMKSHEMIYVFSKKAAFYKRIDFVMEGKDKSYSISHGDGVRKGVYGNLTRSDCRKENDNTRCPLSVIDFKKTTSDRHPTCKSIELYKWLIERYSNEGDTILDPTAGSFNSGRACEELNRKYIGIELNKEFYDKNKLV